MSAFDPNGVGLSNGNLFGFPYSIEEAEIIVIPVPWDATASYGKGTSNGPKAVLEASSQLDFYHPKLTQAYNTKVAMLPIPEEWQAINAKLSQQSLGYIHFLEEGGDVSQHAEWKQFVADMNVAQEKLASWIEKTANYYSGQGKLVAVLGGEHSTPLGLIRTLAQKQSFGILHIDAHADLRVAYEGFEQSHASIMHNVVQLKNVTKLVQVGIRDISEQEVDYIEQEKRICTFFDWRLKEEQYNGKTWNEQCDTIVGLLPQKVYVSFDIDGLKPYLCPHTGTPVAGGFELEETVYLLTKLAESGKEIIGFDLNEVGVSEGSDWDANVGARVLWNLCVAAKIASRK